MSNENEKVTISKKRLDELVDNEKFLMALQSAGVDNWAGYEIAQDIYNDNGEE